LNPGSNLLTRALRLIKPTEIGYLQYSGRTLNAARQYVAAFLPYKPITASVQAVSRNSYKTLGLDLQKNYIKVFVTENAISIARDSSGDRLVYAGRLFQIDNQNNWHLIDGWVSCIAVDVGPSDGSIT